MNKNLYKQAKEVVLSNNNYSISFLQRRLGVGYNRAADVMKIIQKRFKRKGNRRLISKKNKKIRYVR